MNHLPQPAVENKNDNNEIACDSAAVGTVHEGERVEKDGACLSIRTERAGVLKRIAHFQRLEANRKLPGHCSRCGKPNANGKRRCDRCRAYQADYKARARVARLGTTEGSVKELAQFRRELSRLRATVKNMANRYRIAYRHGYAAGAAGRRARFKRDIQKYQPPTVSKQEAATFCHAFDRGEP